MSPSFFLTHLLSHSFFLSLTITHIHTENTKWSKFEVFLPSISFLHYIFMFFIFVLF